MMDFFVREVRSVVEGPMLIVRFGSCGGIGPDATIGSLTLASETAFCYRNYDHFSNPEQKQPYFLSQPIKGDEAYEQEVRNADFINFIVY
jgi:uridine phosphorylase